MSRPFSFSSPTKLWHHADGWREFGVGEMDPGDAWSEIEGGEYGDGGKASAAALIQQSRQRADNLQRNLASRDHDLAQSSARTEFAQGKLREFEQRTLQAEIRADNAEAGLQEVTRDRNRLVDFCATLQRQMAAYDEAMAAGELDLAPVADADELAIPDDWEDLPFFKLRSMASKLAGHPLTDKKSCIAAVNQHLANLVM